MLLKIALIIFHHFFFFFVNNDVRKARLTISMNTLRLVWEWYDQQQCRTVCISDMNRVNWKAGKLRGLTLLTYHTVSDHMPV